MVGYPYIKVEITPFLDKKMVNRANEGITEHGGSPADWAGIRMDYKWDLSRPNNKPYQLDCKQGYIRDKAITDIIPVKKS